jgi:hypothetical protein
MKYSAIRLMYLCTIIFSIQLHSTTSYAEFDPVTVGMTIGLVSDGVSLLGNKSSDVGAATTEAILANVEALNQRMTEVESGIIELMSLVNELPEIWRKDFRSVFDKFREENFIASGTLVSETLRSLSDKSAPKTSSQERLLRKRIEAAAIPFKIDAVALQQRSGATSTYVISAMLREIALERFLGLDQKSIDIILSRYDEYFANMQLSTFDGSLANVREKVESKETGTRKDFFDNQLGGHLNSTHSGEVVIFEVTRAFWPTAAESIKNGIMTYRHSWNVATVPLPEYPDLIHIQIEEKIDRLHLYKDPKYIPVKPHPPLTPSILSTIKDINDVDEVADKSYGAAKQIVLEKAKILNALNEEIAHIRAEETAVALARALIANWKADAASTLAANIKLLQHDDISKMEQEINDSERQLKADAIKAKMEDTRELALTQVAQAEARLRTAYSAAKADAWRQDLLHSLAVVQFSIRSYEVVATYLPESKPPVAKPTSEDPVTPKSEEPKAEKDDEKKTKVTAKPVSKQKKDVVDVINNSSDPRLAVFKFTDAARGLINQADKMPAESWEKLPPGTTKPEALYTQALADLNLADQADLALLDGKSKPQPLPNDADLFRTGAGLMAKGDRVGTILAALRPSAAGGDRDEIGGWQDRNSLKKLALGRLASFAGQRASQGAKAGAGK